MDASLIQKLRCPRTHVELRPATAEEKQQLKLSANEDAFVTVDLKYYYLVDQGLVSLLADSAREFPSRG